MVWPLTLALPKCVHLQDLRHVSLLQRYIDCCNWLVHVLLYKYAISIESYSPINKIYSFVIFSLLIYAVISLLKCPDLILYLYIHLFLLDVIFSTEILFGALYNWHSWKYLNLCTVSLLLYFMVLKTISPGCGVWASLMLFLCQFQKLQHG